MNQVPYHVDTEYLVLKPATDGHFDLMVFGIFFLTFLLSLAGLMLHNPKRR